MVELVEGGTADGGHLQLVRRMRVGWLQGNSVVIFHRRIVEPPLELVQFRVLDQHVGHRSLLDNITVSVLVSVL